MDTTNNPDSAGTEAEVDAEALIARAFQTEQPKGTPEEKPEKPEVSEPEESTEQSEETEGEELVLSQEYIESLDDEQKRQLAEWVGSGLGKDMGKLRSEKRELQEQLDDLKAKYEESIQQFQPKSDNPFSDLTDEKSVETKEKELNEAIKYWRSIERKNDWQTNDQGDEGYYQGNTFYPKEAVMAAVDQWTDQLPKLVEQKYRIRESRNLGPLAEQEFSTAKKELSWLSDTESDMYKAYDKLVSDRDVQMIADISPKLGAKMKRLLAHAVNSMETKSPSQIKLPKRGLPSRVGDTATGTARQEKGSEPKEVRAAREKVASGKYTDEDVVSAFIARHFTN